MNRKGNCWSASVAAIFSLATATSAQNTLEDIQSLNGVIPDGDVDLLIQMTEALDPTPLDYSFQANFPGWLASLAGTYDGRPLNVTYSGSTAAWPIVTWTTKGTYGADTWSGDGSARIVSCPGGFDISDFSSSLPMGALSGGLSGEIPTYREAPFENHAHGTSGLSSLAGSNNDGICTWTEKNGVIKIDGVPQYVTLSDFHRDGKTYVHNYFREGTGWAPIPKGAFYMSGYIWEVPEPSTLTLAAAGIAYVCRRRFRGVVRSARD